MSQDLFSMSLRQSDEFDDLTSGLHWRRSLPGWGVYSRWPFSLVRPWLIKGLILANVMIYLVWGGLALYRVQMRPNLEQLQTQTERARLIGEAEAYLAAERYGLAIRKFQELLDEFPGDAEGQRGIARAVRGRDLAARYQQAVALLDAEQWDEAIAALHGMMAVDAGYKDVPARLAFAEAQRELSHRYQEAEARFLAADWQAAIEFYEAIRKQDPDYRRPEVTARLFDSYVNRGTQLLSCQLHSRCEVDSQHTGRSVAMADEAARLFRQALTLRPKEPYASAQRRVAELYRDGLDLYLRGQWLEATGPLRAAYDQGLTLGGGAVEFTAVVEMLRSAHAMAGDVYAEAGDYDRAIEQYEASLELMSDAKLAAEMLARQELGRRISGKLDVEAYKALIDEYRRAVNK